MLKSATCLAVLRNEQGKLVFAGDRRLSWDMSKAQVAPRPKITKRKGLLFAGTGVSFLCDLITDVIAIPDYDTTTVDPFLYIHNVLLPEIHKLLNEKGLLDKDIIKMHNKELEAAIIIGMKGQLFELSLDDTGILVDAIDTPHTHGCGGKYALGVLKYLEKINSPLTTEEKLRTALEVASLISPGCDANIDILVED